MILYNGREIILLVNYIPMEYSFPDDPSPLCPSDHGEDCLFNGDHQEYECCCDECNYYLDCFPDWKEFLEIEFPQKKTRL